MSKINNDFLENMSFNELMELEKELRKELEKQGVDSFWKSIEKMDLLNKEQRKVNETFREKEELLKSYSSKFKAIEDLGFSIVIFDRERIGIINYNKKQIKDEYYSLEFDKKTQQLKRNSEHNKVSKADFEKIEKILLGGK